MDLSDPFHARLAGEDEFADPELVDAFSLYHGEPAIFTADVPEDAGLPYAVTDANELEEPWDTKTTAGRAVERSVRIYGAATGDASLVDDMAERARNLFHRRPVPVPGYGVFIADVIDGPRRAPTDETLYGRLFTVRLVMSQEE